MNINYKYKTTLCKHFESNKECPRAEKCHFAHGKEELREIKDPLPQNNPFVFSKQPYLNISNFKTMTCKYYKEGNCKYNGNCSFAHGEEELVKSQNDKDSNPDSMKYGSFQSEMGQGPMIQPNADSVIKFNKEIIQGEVGSLEQMVNLSEDLKEKIKKVKDFLKSDNISNCQLVLNEIFSSQDISQEESTKIKATAYKNAVEKYENEVQGQISQMPMYYPMYPQMPLPNMPFMPNQFPVMYNQQMPQMSQMPQMPMMQSMQSNMPPMNPMMQMPYFSPYNQEQDSQQMKPPTQKKWN